MYYGFRTAAGLIAGAALVAACTSSSDAISTTTTSSDTTTTTLPPPTTTTTIPPLDATSLEWERQVLLTNGSPLQSSWYTDITSHPIGFMAAGVGMDGQFERPMAWLSREGLQWIPIDIPPTIQGHFSAVANNEKVAVFVGYDTGRSSGLIVTTPRGKPPEQVTVDENVAFTEVVATGSGFLAYGLEAPRELGASPVLYTSNDGYTWEPYELLPILDVLDVIPGSEGKVLELEKSEILGGAWIRDTTLMAEPGDQAVIREVPLPTVNPNGIADPLTAIDTNRGFLVGGYDIVSGSPLLWDVTIVEGAPPEVEVLEPTRPEGSQLFDSTLYVVHLARSEAGWHAFVESESGTVETWGSEDRRTWTVGEVVGIHPSSPFYDSATFPVTVPEESEAELSPPRTLVTTSGGITPDTWLVGEEVINLAEQDAVGNLLKPYPVIIGEHEGAFYARLVEHAPRWTQTDPDVVRSRVFATSGSTWSEIGTTAWDRNARIQSVVGLSGKVTAFATASLSGNVEVNEAYPIDGHLLESPRPIEADDGRGRMFETESTESVAVVVASSSGGNRLSAFVSDDMESWSHQPIAETSNSYIGAVCAGAGRVWIMGREGSRPFSVGQSWSTVDGLTWSRSTPSLGGAQIGDFTSCDGDAARIVAGALPGPLLLTTEDGLIWEALDLPLDVLSTDIVLEVAVEDDLVGIVVEHQYAQPRHRAWLFNGEEWSQLLPEDGADVNTMALTAGRVHLGGASEDGSTMWNATFDP